MNRSALVRCLSLGMAFVHTFPARKHLTAFFAAPSLGESWKGFGALVAIAIYLLPTSVQARALSAAWRRRRAVLGACGVILALAHGVPALDHLPRFLERPTWHDGWRGFLSAAAVAWFVLPVPAQARALAALTRIARLVSTEPRRLATSRAGT
jgi:hypothetical protein